jgi:hypothetical protein
MRRDTRDRAFAGGTHPVIAELEAALRIRIISARDETRLYEEAE